MVAWLAILALVIVARVWAVFTENINWDEFAFLQRAAISARTGDVVGGGRPGLGTLLLIPFAEGCRSAVNALVQARLLWTAMVIAAGVAFWFMLQQVVPKSPHRWLSLATGTSLWIMAPHFMRFSTQVRTDQPAILFGLLGGLALLASRRRILWAVVAGVLLAVGFLFTQKLLYVGGLVAVATAGQLLIVGEWHRRREAGRLLVSAAAFLIVIAAYAQFAQDAAGGPALLPVSDGLDTFDYYRDFVGWRFYREMVPYLVPQLLVFVCLILLSSDWLRDRTRHGRQLAVAWGVTLMGVAVLLVHAGRFPYFYMVLGLFPAAAGALITGPILERLQKRDHRLIFLSSIWVPLAAMALVQAMDLAIDTQSHQRDTLAFIDRNFAPDARGFNGRAALACRNDPDPFPVRFNQHIRKQFAGDAGVRQTGLMISEFRMRPVMFMIAPGIGEPYPRELWEFWGTRYVRYSGTVFVPGRYVSGEPGWTDVFEVIVPGEYVWRSGADPSIPLLVGGRLLEPGSSIVFNQPGTLPIALPAGGEGMLSLALPEPPGAASLPFFLPMSRTW